MEEKWLGLGDEEGGGGGGYSVTYRNRACFTESFEINSPRIPVETEHRPSLLLWNWGGGGGRGGAKYADIYIAVTHQFEYRRSRQNHFSFTAVAKVSIITA